MKTYFNARVAAFVCVMHSGALALAPDARLGPASPSIGGAYGGGGRQQQQQQSDRYFRQPSRGDRVPLQWNEPLAPMQRYNNDSNRRGSSMQQWDRQTFQQNDNNPWWEEPYPSTNVQGYSRRTWSNNDPYSQGHVVSLDTEGRPLNAAVEVWEGPNNTPAKMTLYSEDGSQRPFDAVIQNRGGRYGSNTSTMSIQNTGPLEFPVNAGASSYYGEEGRGSSSSYARQSRTSYYNGASPSYGGGYGMGSGTTIQGGSLRTWTFDGSVTSAQVTLQTQGLPLMATIELLGVGGYAKQLAEIDTQDGYQRPVSVNVDLSNYNDKVIEIRNKGPMEFPLEAIVEPHYGW